MTRRINVTETPTASAATYALQLGTHVANDLLLAILTQDTGTTTISLGSDLLTSVTAATDTFVYSGGDYFDNGIQVTFTGTLGTSLTAGTRYWVRDLDTTANSFKVSATDGGAVFDVTGSPSGVTCHRMTGGASANNNGAGWAMVGTQAASQGARMAFAYKIASGAGTASPTFTGTNDDWIGTCVVWRDVDITTPIEGWMRSDWGNSSSISTAASNTVAASSAGGTTVITPSADSVLVYAWCSDGSNVYMRTKLADTIADSKRGYGVAEGVSHIVAHNQLASAACPDVTMYCSTAAEGGNGWVLSLKNKSGGELQKQARVTATENSGISNWFGNFGAVHGAVSWAKASTFVAAAGGAHTITINGTAITVSDVALGAVTTTAPQNESPWGSISAIPHATDATVIAGGNWVLPAPENLSGKIITFNFELDTSSVNARVGTEGLLCGFASSDGSYAVYQLRTKAQGWAISQAFAAFIDLGNATVLASAGTVDMAAVDRFMIGWHRVSGTVGSVSLGIKNMSVLTKAAITGGGPSDPANFKVLADDLFSWGSYRMADVQGLTQVLGKFNVQLGDGTHATHIDAAPSFEFQRAYSATAREWNVNPSRVAVDVYAKSGDTINLAAGVLASETLQGFTINASSSTGATYSFAGQSFIGMAVVWKTGIACANVTFKQCTIDFKGAAPNTIFISQADASVDSTTGAVCAFDANTSLTSGSISCVKEDGTNAGHFMQFGASVTAMTIDSTTLTGTPTTSKFKSLLMSGVLTITTDGLGTTLVAGDVTFPGGSTATAEIAAPALYQSVAITGLAATYRLQIFDIEYVLTVSGITVTPTAGATYTHNGITWTVRSASIVAGAGTITVYGTGTPAASGTLTKTGGTGDASVAFSAYVVDGTELYIGVPAATSYTWTDSVAAAAPRVIRVRVMEDGPGTSDAIEMIDAIVGMCGITEGTESVGYLVAAVADDVYNDRGVDGSAITGITIDDTTLRLEIASGTITNFNGTDVLVVDGRDLYAYETYWLGTTAGIRDEARFIEAVDAVNFRCSNFKLKGTSGYPIMINNCFIVDAATGIFSSMVDYSGDPISNHPEHMKAIVVTTSDSVVTGTLAEFIAAVPTAADNAIAVWSKTLPL